MWVGEDDGDAGDLQCFLIDDLERGKLRTVLNYSSRSADNVG